MTEASWYISPEERTNYTNIFNSYGPVKGKITGVQARRYLVKSALPNSVLAQIWNLSDVDKDGQLTAEEFAIAAYLCKMRSQDYTLPDTLPQSLVPTSSTGNDGSVFSAKKLPAVQQSNRLKFIQKFNQTDKNRQGFVSGLQARHLFLLESNVPPAVLSQVWELSDQDKDGNLVLEEFVIAFHLLSLANQGTFLPKVLPDHLLTPAGKKARLAAAPKAKNTQAENAARMEMERLKMEEAERKAEAERKRKETLDRIRNKTKQRHEENKRVYTEIQNNKHIAESALYQKRLKKKELTDELSKHKSEHERNVYRIAQLNAQLNRLQTRKNDLKNKTSFKRDDTFEKDHEALALNGKVQALELQVKALANDYRTTEQRLHQLGNERMNISQRFYNNHNVSSVEVQQEKQQVQNGCKEVLTNIGRLELIISKNRNELSQRRIHYGELQALLKQEKSRLAEMITQRSRIENERIATIRSRKGVQQALEEQQRKAREEAEQRKIEAGHMARLAAAKDHQAYVEESLKIEKEKEDRKKEEEEMRRRAKEEQMRQREQQRMRQLEQQKQIQAKKDKEEEDRNRRVADRENKRKAQQAEFQQQGAQLSNNLQQYSDNYLDNYNDNQNQNQNQNQYYDQEAYDDEEYLQEHGQEQQDYTYVALYGYDSTNDGDLCFEEGDYIYVTEQPDDGWWCGELNGKVGWFPSGYVDLPENITQLHNDMQATTEEYHDTYTNDADTLGEEKTYTDFTIHLALYDYISTEPGDLNFYTGEHIYVYEKNDDDWWYGECSGHKGNFPMNYIDSNPLEDKPEPPAPTAPPPAPITAPITPVSIVTPASRDDLLDPNVNGSEYCTALYGFDGENEDDLPFVEGDVITILQKDEEWYQGSLGDRTGWFPANYVELSSQPTDSVEEQPTHEPIAESNPFAPEAAEVKSAKPVIAKVISDYIAEDETQITLKKGSLITVLSTENEYWWEGTINARGQESGQTGWFPMDCVMLLSKNKKKQPLIEAIQAGQNMNRSDSLTLPKQAQKPKQVQVIAKFDYVAQRDDELSFYANDMFVVTDQSDPDWWEGEFNGMTGAFPANYVEVKQMSSNRSGTLGKRTTTNMATEGTRWADSVDPGVLATLSAQEQKRQELIYELLLTEITFVSEMEMVMEIYYHPIAEKKLMTQKELDTLFINWEDLLNTNAELLQKLEAAQEEGNMCIYNVGEIMCEAFTKMDGYAHFCQHQTDAVEYLTNTTGVILKDFVKQCEKDPRAGPLGLTAALLMPMQRVCRYPLLMKKIYQETPENHPEYNDCAHAFQMSEQLTQEINERVKRKENREKLMNIRNRLEYNNLSTDFLLNPDTEKIGPRQFVYEGDLTRKNKELRCILLNDFLLLTTASKNGEKFTLFKAPIPVGQIVIKDVQNTKSSGEDNLFQVVWISEIYNFKAKDGRAKQEWVKFFTQAIDAYAKVEQKLREEKKRIHFVGRITVTINEISHPSLVHGKSAFCRVSLGQQDAKDSNPIKVHNSKLMKCNFKTKLSLKNWNSSLYVTVHDGDTTDLLGTLSMNCGQFQSITTENFTNEFDTGGSCSYNVISVSSKK